MKMRRILAVLGAIVAAAAISGTAQAAAAPQQADRPVQLVKVQSPAGTTTGVSPLSSWYGCKSGYACLYTGTAGSAPSGSHTDYYYYGYRNLSNVIGYHWLVNNQTGGAKVYPCTGYNGTNCHEFLFSWSDGKTTDYIRAGWALKFNMTPVNSLRLAA